MAQSAAIPFPSSARALSSAVSIPWPLWAGAASISSIILGLYWDISWHITIGRDTFWTPAHMAIQLGAVLAALSCGALIFGATFGKDPAGGDFCRALCPGPGIKGSGHR